MTEIEQLEQTIKKAQEQIQKIKEQQDPEIEVGQMWEHVVLGIRFMVVDIGGLCACKHQGTYRLVTYKGTCMLGKFWCHDSIFGKDKDSFRKVYE